MTRCRPLNRKRKQNPIRCGHDPAGLRSALCRDSVRNGYALSRCVAPRCRKPKCEPPIRTQNDACTAAAYPPDWPKRAFEFPILLYCRAPARTVCLINPDNAASLRIADRFGYRAFGNCLYKDAPCIMLERLSPLP
nr:hypothetical protein [Citrobacter freundii]